MSPITPQMLRDYLTDSLPDTEMARVERALRDDPSLRDQLQKIKDSEDQGEHTVGAIWRRERVSCPKREQLATYLQKAADQIELDYIRFHIEVIGCAVCQANLDDLKATQKAKKKK